MTKKILNYSVLTGLFLIPFIGFIVPGAMFFPFISGKGFTFRILVEIIFGLWINLAFLDAQYRPKMSWITKSVLFFVVAIFVSDLLRANGRLCPDHSLGCLLFCGFFCLNKTKLESIV